MFSTHLFLYSVLIARILLQIRWETCQRLHSHWKQEATQGRTAVRNCECPCYMTRCKNSNRLRKLDLTQYMLLNEVCKIQSFFIYEYIRLIAV